MAYNIESLVKILEQILQPDHHDSWILDPRKKPEIRSLLEKALFINNSFEKFSPGITSHNIESLESRIRDATYKAEDILESHMTDQIRSVGKGNKFTMSPEGLQEVIAEFDYAVDDIKKIMDDGSRLLNNSSPVAPATVDPNPKDILVGLDQVCLQLKDQLAGQESNLEVIPIVGMGGIGKTTLARNAYDDPFVVSHFDTRAWTTISQHRDNDEENLRRILIDLLGCVAGQRPDEMLHEKNDRLAERLYKSLIGRRYLIVLDDMWVTDDWDDFRRFFPNDQNGSRVMVTTREMSVASYSSSHSSHLQMQLLGDEESWNLLRQKVFVQEPCPPDLEVIGRKIAENCKGLPLTVHVIGGVLSQGKRTVEYWSEVAKDVSSIMGDNDDHFSRILSLSYNHLPVHLKPCFLYMGAFPEDAEIRRSRLIKLWVAEGFLKPIPYKSLEEAADVYLKALVDRNLIYVRQKVTDGMVKSYSIHDLLRDLCVRKASQDKFLHVMNQEDPPVCLRRASADSSCSTRSLENLDMTCARSFLHIGSSRRNISYVVFRLRLLKVLDILEVKLKTFPDEMLQLVNLRYLAFRCSSHLSSVSSLVNIETIIFHLVRSVRVTVFGPMSRILDMPRLRHIKIMNAFYGCTRLGDPNCFGLKENLQSLSGLELNHGLIQRLTAFPNLKKLGLQCPSSFASDDDVDLSCLLKLESFKCSYANSAGDFFFVFPPSLTNVSLRNYQQLVPQNLNVIGNLPNLQVLKLQSCEFVTRKWEPVEGEFSQLRFLLLERTDLENWVADETNLPRLERLVIRHCRKLAEIPIAIGDIPTLGKIEVHRCSSSAMDSAKQILEEQIDLGNYGLQVSITPSSWINN